MALHIRLLQQSDIQPIAAAFEALGWNKPASQYERYLAEQQAGERVVFVAFLDDVFAGYVTVNWLSDYPPFRLEHIPEIQDFNVLPQFRQQGIGNTLMDEAERKSAERSRIVGLGVGLFVDYGAAQRIYARRGYIPDGRGMFFQGRFVQYGESVIADDDLAIYMTKLHKIE